MASSRSAEPWRAGTAARRWLAAVACALLAVSLAAAPRAQATSSHGVVDGPRFSAHQRGVLRQIAADTWRFFELDVDPNTHLPLDNLGPDGTRGSYTSARLAQGPCDPTVSDYSQVESTVTPHASVLALDVAPQQAYRNIVKLRREFPDVYRTDGGFFDAVNPSTGAVGHRRLVLDQSMIMAALDNALNNRRLQRWFAADPLARAARTYLGAETMSLS